MALAALCRAGVALTGPVELAALVDEEETGKGIRAYLRGSDRSGFAGCIVAEPTDLQTIIAARGDSYLEITVTGRAAHAGNPSDGVTADRRLLLGEMGEIVLAETVARIDAMRLAERGLGVAVDLTMQMPGFETPPDHRLVILATRAVRDAGGQAHRADESGGLDDLVVAARTYALCALRLLAA